MDQIKCIKFELCAQTKRQTHKAGDVFFNNTLLQVILEWFRNGFLLTKVFLRFHSYQHLLCLVLDSMLGKLPLLFTVTVNLETIISKLGKVLFHNNSYIRWLLFLY